MSWDNWDNDYNNVAAYYEDHKESWFYDPRQNTTKEKAAWKFQKLGVELHNGTIDPIDDSLINLYKLTPGYTPFSGQKIVLIK